jgi:hypothetical protein
MNPWQQYISDPKNLDNMIAGAAVGVSFLSTLLALWAVYLQREHNRISVRPMPDIVFGDYENEIKVGLHNHGLGPMILVQVEILKNQVVMADNLVDLMPGQPRGISWKDFVKQLKDRILAPGEEKMLIKLSGSTKNKTFIKFRNKVREELSPLVVKVYYKGIYDKRVLVFEKSFGWFGRPI